jgi:hypothetical protein
MNEVNLLFQQSPPDSTNGSPIELTRVCNLVNAQAALFGRLTNFGTLRAYQHVLYRLVAQSA